MQENYPHLAKWAPPLLETCDKNPLSIPVDAALREAVRVACSLKKFWSPHKKIPGFSSLSEFTTSTADDLISLIRGVQEAQLLYFIEAESEPIEEEDPIATAQRAIAALRAPLEYLGDTLPELQQAQLEKIRALPEQKQTDEASLSLLLRLYTEVASHVTEQLSTLGESFDEAMIEDAKQQIVALKEFVNKSKKPPKDAQLRYYQMLALLQEKVGKIRAAARYLYREHKKILREFTSSYERTRKKTKK